MLTLDQLLAFLLAASLLTLSGMRLTQLAPAWAAEAAAIEAWEFGPGPLVALDSRPAPTHAIIDGIGRSLQGQGRVTIGAAGTPSMFTTDWLEGTKFVARLA